MRQLEQNKSPKERKDINNLEFICIKDYLRSKEKKGNWLHIEHIYPRNDSKNTIENYLEIEEVNEIGNLITINDKINIGLSNDLPRKKYAKKIASNSYHNQEIIDTINRNADNLTNEDDVCWSSKDIKARGKRIKSFALAYFSYHPVCLENNEFVNCDNYSNLMDNFVAIERDKIKDIFGKITDIKLSIKENIDEFNLKSF